MLLDNYCRNGLVVGQWIATEVGKGGGWGEHVPDTSLHEKHRQMGRQTYMMPQIDEYLVRISNKCWKIQWNFKSWFKSISCAYK